MKPSRHGNRLVVVHCPFCGRKHIHGLPAGQGTVGYRLAHCAPGPHRTYLVREVA